MHSHSLSRGRSRIPPPSPRLVLGQLVGAPLGSVVLGLTRAVGIGSWEGRREKGTAPSGSSQHLGWIKRIMKPHPMLLRLERLLACFFIMVLVPVLVADFDAEGHSREAEPVLVNCSLSARALASCNRNCRCATMLMLLQWNLTRFPLKNP